MLRVYLRVSSVGQHTHSQRPELIRYAHGQESKFYEDKASGKSMNRPAFERMMLEAVAGDTIVCVRLDRLGRTASGLTRLFEELRVRRINLVSLREGIDLKTISGSLIANVLASVAAYETEVRQERVAAGMEAKRKRVAAGIEPPWNKGGRPKGQGKVTMTLRLSILREWRKRVPIAQIAREHGLSRVTIYSVIKEVQ